MPSPESERARLEAAEAALYRSESMWRAIVESAVDGIIVINQSGRIETFNPAAEKLFGYRAAEVLGRNVNVLMPAPYHGEHDGYLARYLASRDPHIIGIGREVMGRRRDGTEFPLHLSVGELTIGHERKFTGILHDLSIRAELAARLRSSEARWRSIVESAVDGIIVLDESGCIEAFNPAATRLFGYTADEVRGRNVSMLMPAPYRDEHDGYIARFKATREARIIGIGREVTALRKDGSTFPVHLSVGELTVDGQQKFTGILHDLSSRVQMETQLREQTALARLGEMAAVIAHEVKNPLAGVRGAVQVIGGRLPAGSKDAEIAVEIVKRIDGLNDLLKDLLLFARPPRPKPAPVDLVSLISTTVDLLRSDPAFAHVQIDIEGSSHPVVADPELMKIVFSNLIVNGVHAMQGRGAIRVRVSHDDAACCIVVQDEGPGIPREIRDKIFTPFFTTKARGTGLGLATSKRLIEAHAGTIRIECPAAGGTIVTVQVPVGESAAPSPAAMRVP